MRKSIYQIAIECKDYSDKCIKYFIKPERANPAQYYVDGANQHYEGLLLSLCDVTSEKYPYLSTKLKEHTSQYDLMPVIHQSAIDELVDYIIALEQTVLSSRKIFISHASSDATIVNSFVKEILMLGCGLSSSDIFCTLDPTAIRTGDDFRNVIIENMKRCDFILCMISNNYRNSEVCQNEMGVAWALEHKRILPFKFPNIKFTELGFLNVVKQAADITDVSKLDELYVELCECYGLQQNWINFNQRKSDFLKVVEQILNKGN